MRPSKARQGIFRVRAHSDSVRCRHTVTEHTITEAGTQGP